MPDFPVKIIRVDHLTCEANVTIPRDHPCFNGHFDHFPILPAVAQLSLIQEIVEKHRKHRVRISNGHAIKFLQPIKPGDLLTVRIEYRDAHKVTFTIDKNKKIATKGQLQTSLLRNDE